MIDPVRYIRKAVINAISTNNFKVYEQNPPGGAVTPYGIVSVTVEQRPVKGLKVWRANIELDIYNEFREYGGRKAIDQLTDDIIDVMVPNDGLFISVENFEHNSCRLVSTSERAAMDNSLTTFVKTIRFQSIVNE